MLSVIYPQTCVLNVPIYMILEKDIGYLDRIVEHVLAHIMIMNDLITINVKILG